MNKSTKGAVAVAAAAILLVGGAGTLAFWKDSATLSGDKVNSGELKLVNPGPGTWTLNGAPAIGATLIVPGDKLVYTGTFDIKASGDNLAATLSLDTGDAAGDLTPYVTTTATTDVGGANLTQITDDNNGQTIHVKATVNFPFGTTADNASQAKSLDLGTMTVTLTQLNPVA